jgi:hypothetical protein
MASQGEVPLISSSWPGAQSLDLEDLMAELRVRVSAARRSQDRLSELLDAVVAISAAAEGSKAGAVAADPLSHRTVGVALDGSAWAELHARANRSCSRPPRPRRRTLVCVTTSLEFSGVAADS